MASSASATTTITDISVNSTNVSATDYVIGNTGLCLGVNCISSWSAVNTSASGNSFNQTYHNYVTANISNSTTWWAGLTAPLASWLSTFNQTYHDMWVSNISAKTDYVNNASERALFLNTANSSYPRKDVADTISEDWTFLKSLRVAGNLTYVNYETLNVNGTIQPPLNNWFNIGIPSSQWANIYGVNIFQNGNAVLDNSTGYLKADVYNTTQSDARYLQSYTETDPKWQGNSTDVLANLTNLINSNASTNARIDGLGTGIKLQTTTCSGTDKVSAINNVTGVVTCSTDELGGAGSSFNQTYHSAVFYNYSAKTDYVNNVSERSLFLSTYNSTYASKPDTTYNSTYHTYVFNNLSNSSMYWDNLDSPLASWTDTFNSSYHGLWASNRTSTSNSSSYWDDLDSPLASWTNNYNSSYHDFWASNRSSTSNSSSYWDNLDSPLASWTDTFNQSYHNFWLANISDSARTWAGLTAPLSSWLDTFNQTYHDAVVYNYSAKTDYVQNATERALFLDTYNSTYAAKPDTTYNSTYHTYVYNNISNISIYWAGLTAPLSAWTDTYNVSYHGLWSSNRTSTANSSSYWDNLDSPLASWTDTYNVSYHNFWLANISAKADYVNNVTERGLFTATYNSSYHDIFATNITNRSNYWDGLNSPTDITGIGQQAQNLNMSNYNVTYVECIIFKSGGQDCSV